MAILQSFPHVDQLDSATHDGHRDENREFNCVPASICAGLRYLTGDQSFVPDQLKDAAYPGTGPGEGENYANKGTAATAFVPFCAQYGVKLYPLNGSPDELVRLAKEHLALDHPVIFTEPDPYCSAYQRDTLGWTHVCVFYKNDANSLTAMDPFGKGGHDVTQSDAEWSQLLRGDQIWIMEKDMILDLNNSIVAHYFSATSDGKWQCKRTGNILQYGMLKFYRSYGKDAFCGLTYLGLPLSNEISITGLPGVVKQDFERGCLVYDPNKKFDNPPGAGEVYLMHLPK